jgi:hypothetical protein
MKSIYTVAHDKDADIFSNLSEEQIISERKSFASSLIFSTSIFRFEIDSDLKARCESVDNLLRLSLEGEFSQKELDSFANRILIDTNSKKVRGKVGYPHFVKVNSSVDA